MSDNLTADQIAAMIGIEAQPEIVRRLTELVSRQDAPIDEIGKVICADKEFTGRLLRAANPRAEGEHDYTVTSVDAALMRAGVGCALLLAMSDPLIRAVKKTFLVMLNTGLKDVAPGILTPLDDEHVLCNLAFTGRATGTVAFHFSMATANAITELILGGIAENPAERSDVIGELGNMIVGNFKSNLWESGLHCKLSPPVVSVTDQFRLRANGGLAERIGFSAEKMSLFVDILVNPWG